MIVVDANVILYWTAESPEADQVDELRKTDGDWYTVPLWKYEFTNALVRMIRAKVINQAAALKALTKAEAVMTPREQPVAQQAAFEAAMRYGISGYDAQYVALAQMHGHRFVTADAPLARKTPHVSALLSEVARRGTI